MKLILSRKGCDSSTGGIPSPIFPDGRICSVPIPQADANICYADIALDKGVIGRDFGRMETMGDLVEQLSRGKLLGRSGVHLDPDLNAHCRVRLIENEPDNGPGWRPLFGQAGAAAGHLRKQAVGVGDLFLFYGWFRQTTLGDEGLTYVRGAPDLHLLFGWLQVGAVIALAAGEEPPRWALEHPHCAQRVCVNNTLFIAADSLSLPGLRARVAGGGLFRKFSQRIQLTETGALRGQWLLPRWFWPWGEASVARPPLSYHGNPTRWEQSDDGVRLRTVGRGQEFVLDCAAYPEVIPWLMGLFTFHSQPLPDPTQPPCR